MQIIKNKRQKGLLVLSIFILCITGLTAWWLSHAYSGGPKQDKSQHQAFNTKLPEANTKDAGKNKLEIYMQAEKDSARLKEQQKKDSLERRWFNPGPPEEDVFANEYTPKYKQGRPSHYSGNSITQNEEKVNARLKKLYEAINQPTNTDPEKSLVEQTDFSDSKYVENIAQLEKLLSQVQNSDTGSNQEMQQLQSVLDKMLDIQYPERVKERLSKKVEKSTKPIFKVTTGASVYQNDSPIETITENSFWGLQEQQLLSDSNDFTTISSVIHQDQLLQDGSVVKLRLLQDIFINGAKIPANNFLYGECTLGDQRLYIHFNSIAFNKAVYPVQLTAFDIDGIEGIYIPGAIARETAKSGINDAIQQMQLATLDPSIGAQATSAGIQTAQKLLSKKIKKVQVTVKAGHNILLKMKATK